MARPYRHFRGTTRIVWQYLADHWRDVPQPSLREMSKAIGISISNVSHHLNLLESEGIIERDKKMARSIRLLIRPHKVKGSA